ncbi:MAG: hypothetical protein EPO36_03765 [Chloroflexota bacterium]|nr:MAG: hypothetical protein EPO36_03765 [Chloroflexota bacterium]
MIRRPTHRRVSYLATISLVALALLVPAGASAATPDLSPIQYGAPATVSVDSTQGAVVLGVRNDGKSTVSQLFLVEVTILGGSITAMYPSQPSCAEDFSSCTLGQLKPKKEATVIVVFDFDAGSTSATVSGTFNTTGTAGDNDQSHGDSWQVSATVTQSADAQDFAGRFIDLDGNPLVANDQVINDDTNPHATKVIAPQTLIGVTVEDGAVVAQPCDPTKVACAKLFGETSSISVALGGTFAGGFQIVIGFDGSELPGGVNANSIKIYHTYTGGSEVISQKCQFAPNSTTPKSMPCLTASKDGPDLWVTIWTTHNGVMRGLG